MKTKLLIIIPIALLALSPLFFITEASEHKIGRLETEYETIIQDEFDSIERKEQIACEAAILRINECWANKDSQWCDDAYTSIIAFYDNYEAYFEDVCMSAQYDVEPSASGEY